MKKKALYFLLLITAVISNAFGSGNIVTLDLSKPLNPANFVFNPEKGNWVETYNDKDYTFIEFNPFAFSHLIGGYGGSYWDGFTVCSSGDNQNYGNGGSEGWITNQWGCMAGGGIKTGNDGNILKNASGKVLTEKGIPYLVGYWGYFMETEDKHSLQTIFNDGQSYQAVGVYVNNHPWPYYGNSGGDQFANPFTQDGDYFKLIIHGMDKNYQNNGKTVEHYLAKYENGALIQSPDWEWVDLSALGEIGGLYYTLETTDADPVWGPNTAVYFCMDKLQVRKASYVTITMNAISTNITLKNKATNETVDVGSILSGNKYTFKAYPGDYVLYAYSGTTLNGTIDLTITDDATQQFQFYTVTAYATNAGWTLNTDYTINLRVSGKEGTLRNTTTGSSTTAGRATFLVYSGDTYYVQFIPSQSRTNEGYLIYDGSGTVTANATKSGVIPMGYTYTITVPEGATAFIGKKGAHFQRFTEIEASGAETADGNTIYTYKLAGSQEYNYRISQPGKVTYAKIFTKTASAENISITADMLAGNPKEVDHNISSNSGYNVADIFLNINEKGHLKLSSGDTYQLVNLRVWQTVNSITGNYFIEPDYHYTVVNETGSVDNSVVTIDKSGMLNAVGAGTAIVLVTYDAINVPSATGGPFFGAIWPENTGVFVVSVDTDESNITPNMTINEVLNSASNTNKVSGINVDSELDVFYYPENNGGYDYTFTPGGVTSVSLAQPVVGANMIAYNGFSADDVTNNGDGSYTVRLTHGRNIVKMASAAGVSYQVLTAKPVTYTITNASRAGEKIKPGDKVSVRFNTIYHPNTKLSGVYNMSASLQYTANGSAVSGSGNQYAFANAANAQTVSATIPANWDIENDFVFTNGVIKSTGFGDPFGKHREITLEIGRNPNFTAVSCTAFFGILPDVVVKLADTSTGETKISTGNVLNVYPNPFVDYIKVEASSDSQLSIYNLTGQCVLSTMIKAGENHIETFALPKGTYLVKCGEKAMKIIK